MCQHDSASERALQVLSLTIFGEPASKANSRRVVRFGSTSRLIKSRKALTYAELFRQQAGGVDQCMDGDIRVTLHIWYASRRPDLDESLILDLLQGVAYRNDRQVKEKHVFWHLDPHSPRTNILVEQMEKKDPGTSRGRKRPRAAQEGDAT
jgi:Holliday junction resolvase RusA-like endonuclease